MRVQLIVVQGKLEGKKIPLVGPVFRIGRGETCHLRPNSAQVSREHAEFVITNDAVSIRDLGSRNGTLVNGKALTRPHPLKDHDLVQIGPLAFEVSMAGAAEPVAPGSSDDLRPMALYPDLPDELASLIPNAPAGIHGGDTIMIAAFKESAGSRGPGADVSDDENDEGYERLPVDDGETEEMPVHDLDLASGAGETDPTARPASKRSSDAAAAILRKLMERRKASK